MPAGGTRSRHERENAQPAGDSWRTPGAWFRCAAPAAAPGCAGAPAAPPPGGRRGQGGGAAVGCTQASKQVPPARAACCSLLLSTPPCRPPHPAPHLGLIGLLALHQRFYRLVGLLQQLRLALQAVVWGRRAGTPEAGEQWAAARAACSGGTTRPRKHGLGNRSRPAQRSGPRLRPTCAINSSIARCLACSCVSHVSSWRWLASRPRSRSAISARLASRSLQGWEGSSSGSSSKGKHQDTEGLAGRVRSVRRSMPLARCGGGGGSGGWSGGGAARAAAAPHQLRPPLLQRLPRLLRLGDLAAGRAQAGGFNIRGSSGRPGAVRCTAAFRATAAAIHSAAAQPHLLGQLLVQRPQLLDLGLCSRGADGEKCREASERVSRCPPHIPNACRTAQRRERSVHSAPSAARFSADAPSRRLSSRAAWCSERRCATSSLKGGQATARSRVQEA